jgi:Holliday junction resolvase RusA-like endonuclease
MVAHTKLAHPNVADRPFALPQHELITTVLMLPAPPSVNSTRRVDWRNHARMKAWQRNADATVMLQGRRRKIGGRYELLIQLSELVKLDADNGLKCLIDYLRRIDLVVDDSPKYLRRLVVEWCHPAVAPEGVRVTIQELAL